jgi:hypothetical protein
MIMIVFGIFWMSMATSIGAPSFLPLFGLLFIGGAVFSMINGTTKAGAYKSGRDDYEARRRQLVNRIEHERNP